MLTCETLVITEHNFLSNHVKLSNKDLPLESDIFHVRLHPALLRPLHTVLSEDTWRLVKLVLIMEIMFFLIDDLLPNHIL